MGTGMNRPLLVAGLTNLETTLQIDSFPLGYSPVHYPFFGVQSAVSGVGYNVAKALTVLGQTVRFASLIGQDAVNGVVLAALKDSGITSEYVLNTLAQTPQSVILYDRNGNRQVHVDLKDIQTQAYPQTAFEQALAGCGLAVLCNVNFTRAFLPLARRMAIPIATDVHAISSLDDPYNADYMAAASILFMSHEMLPCSPEEWVREVMHRYGTEIVVVGLGAEGALLAVKRDDFVGRIPAVRPRVVVNTIGAGDALFSAFVHTYVRTIDPYLAIRKAVVFAGYKIGAKGAAEGFLRDTELDDLAAGMTA